MSIQRRQVLLYSGGMDSLILSYMYPEATLLYCNLQTRYSAKEMAQIKAGPIHNYRKVIYDSRLVLGDQERGDAIINDRNLFMVLIAAIYGDDILLAATAGDLSHDKNEVWAEKTMSLMNYMRADSHHTRETFKNVLLPVKNMSKGEMVRWYLEAGHDPEILIKSISCYAPAFGQCGVCKSCMRKWLALETNGLISDAWTEYPTKADWGTVVNALRSGGSWRSAHEDQYARSILAHYGLY